MKKNTSRGFLIPILIAIIAILLIGIAYYSLHTKSGNGKLSGTATSSVISESQATDIAIDAAVQAKVTTLSSTCIKSVVDSKTDDNITFDLYEIHNMSCGGDPRVSPFITTATVNLSSKQFELGSWKTYSSTTFKFQFQYPNTARLLETPDKNPDHPIVHIINNSGVFTIAVLLDDKATYPLPKALQVLNQSNVIVNGKEMTRIVYGTVDSNQQNQYAYIDYAFTENGKQYEFLADSNKPSNTIDQDTENFLRQILSSVQTF